MRFLLAALLCAAAAGRAGAEDYALLSWHKDTEKVAVTYFPWAEWRAQAPGVKDADIWKARYPACVPVSLRSWKHKAMTLSALKKALPERSKRERWRYNAETGKVWVDPRIPETPAEAAARARAVLADSQAAREAKLEALLELETLKATGSR